MICIGRADLFLGFWVGLDRRAGPFKSPIADYLSLNTLSST